MSKEIAELNLIFTLVIGKSGGALAKNIGKPHGLKTAEPS